MQQNDFGSINLWRRWQQRAPVGRTASIGLIYENGRVTEGIVLCWGHDWIDIAVPREKQETIHDVVTLRLDQITEVDLVQDYEVEAGLYTISQSNYWDFNPTSFFRNEGQAEAGEEPLLSGYVIEIEHPDGRTAEFLPLEMAWEGLHCQYQYDRRNEEPKATLEPHIQFQDFAHGKSGWPL